MIYDLILSREEGGIEKKKSINNKYILMLLNLGYPAEGAGPLANHGSRKAIEETVKNI
ncbi:hypothetical protein [Peptostreptococcus stomatis]|uniref:hypothetical protein n=1 Tax=Peptostreptococcus stomatis TaxID=341694 RepID=UPI0002E33BEB|nr:hypothetical protein [Peptostreptococcus stomatis]